MGLSDIAAGLELRMEQEDRGVTSVDATGTPLVERLRAHADALPCTPEAAETVLDAYATGASVGAAAREASVAPITASKVLHVCGVPGVSPLSPVARDVLRDWLAGDVSRCDALALAGAPEAEFALGTYVETHDPVRELVEAVEGRFEPGGNASVAKRDELAETMTPAADLR